MMRHPKKWCAQHPHLWIFKKGTGVGVPLPLVFNFIFMLTIEECKKYLAEYDLTDAEVAKLRDSLYSIVNEIIDTS